MHYEIDESTYAIKIFDGVNAEPFMFQPHYPNGDSFDSFEEAENWAKEQIKAQNPEYGFFAPNGKGLAGEAKPTPAQLFEYKLASIGLTVDELKAALGL